VLALHHCSATTYLYKLFSGISVYHSVSDLRSKVLVVGRATGVASVKVKNRTQNSH